jgi:hypothetical protein
MALLNTWASQQDQATLSPLDRLLNNYIQKGDAPLAYLMRGDAQGLLKDLNTPKPVNMTQDMANAALNLNPVMGLLGTTKNVYSLLEKQNKFTAPKVPTNSIFQNEYVAFPSDKRKTIDEIIGKGNESKLPTEYIDASQIVPTQKNVTIPNLKKVKDVPTDEAIAVKDNGMYYLIDGHHRVANQLLNNNNNIKIRVLE